MPASEFNFFGSTIRKNEKIESLPIHQCGSCCHMVNTNEGKEFKQNRLLYNL